MREGSFPSSLLLWAWFRTIPTDEHLQNFLWSAECDPAGSGKVLDLDSCSFMMDVREDSVW